MRPQSIVIRHRLALFFLMSLGIAWTFWVPMVFIRRGILPFPLPIIIVSTGGGVSPILSLGILERLTHGEIKLEKILSTMRFRKTRKIWFLVAGFLLPSTIVLGNILRLFSAPNGEWTILAKGPDELGWLLIVIIPLHFFPSLLTSPLFEEPGWRGFAAVELQERFPRDLASLFLGSFWWLWHQPMNVAFDIRPTLLGYLVMVGQSSIIDALFNLSDRNLLVAMFAHQSLGTAFVFLHRGDTDLYVLPITILFVTILRITESKIEAPVVNEPPSTNSETTSDSHC